MTKENFNDLVFPETGHIDHDMLNKLCANDRYCYEQLQSSPKGILFSQYYNSSIFVTSTTKTLVNSTFNCDSNRYITFTTSIGATYPSATTNTLVFWITINNKAIASWKLERSASIAANRSFYVEYTTDRLPGGDHDIKVKARASAGTIELSAGSTSPIQFWIEDMGLVDIVRSSELTSVTNISDQWDKRNSGGFTWRSLYLK